MVHLVVVSAHHFQELGTAAGVAEGIGKGIIEFVVICIVVAIAGTAGILCIPVETGAFLVQLFLD